MSGKVRQSPNGVLDETPFTLLDIMCNYICCNLDIISHERNGRRQLHDDILLPHELEAYQLHHPHLDDKVIWLFADTKRASFSNNDKQCAFFAIHMQLLTQFAIFAGLETLMRHKPCSLSMWYCDRITFNSHDQLARFGDLELGINSKAHL